MLTNKEFSELTAEERSTYFASLTAEEVGQLTKAQAEAYQEWKGEGTSSEEAKADLEEIAKKYFEENPSFEEIVVTEDGIVFHGGVRGENLAANYVKGKTGSKGDMFYLPFKKA